MGATCSFCAMEVGEGPGERSRPQAIEAMRRAGATEEAIARARAVPPDRRVRLLLPGPGDIRICDICVDLYAATLDRELGPRGPGDEGVA